jgi:PAS domain S-box-containing protein
MATTYCLLFIAYLAWRRREIPIAVSLFLGMMAGFFYSFGYAFELVSSNLEQIRFWLKVEYIGISFGTLIWFTMIMQYTGHQSLLRKGNYLLLAVVPILTFTSHYTNDWHYLFYEKVEMDESEGFPLASLTVGPFYKLHVAYSYSLFVIGMGLLIRMYRNVPSYMKKQAALMMIGSCAPYVITLLYLSGLFNTKVDFSPIGFLISGVFFIWGIYQFNLLRLVPLASQKVFESMKDAVIVFDLDHRITNFNLSAQEIISDLNNKNVIGQQAPHIFSTFPVLLEKIMQGPSIESKVILSKEVENLRYYYVQVSYVNDSNQKPIGKMLMISDITEAVIAEETLQTNAKQLSELNAFKDKMFTIIAHDIRDPLAVLVNLMELLRDEIQYCDKSHEEIANEMEQQIENTLTLAESLLEWFRSQGGGMKFNPGVWNLSQTVQNNTQLLQVLSDGKRIHMISDIPKSTLVYADKEMLDLIIRNLLSNAIKFTNYGGNIQVGAIHSDGQVIVSVKDTGGGISSGQAKSLFQEKYPDSSQGTAGEKGFGLGLTLCREFVRINGGDIWFESTPNQGSIFYFSIPFPDGSTTAELVERGNIG